jgi:hypothetical protein
MRHSHENSNIGHGQIVGGAMGFHLPGDQPNGAAGPIWTASDATKAALATVWEQRPGELNKAQKP